MVITFTPSFAELEGIDLEMKLEDIITAMNSCCFELDEDNSKIIPLLERAMADMTEMLENEEIVDDYIRKFMADAILKDFNDAYYSMYPSKRPPEKEPEDENTDEASIIEQELSRAVVTLMASTSSSKDDDKAENEEPEQELPQLPPSQEILQAAIDMLSFEATYVVVDFVEFLDDYNEEIKVKVGEVGFVKYQEYLDSLITEKR